MYKKMAIVCDYKQPDISGTYCQDHISGHASIQYLYYKACTSKVGGA